MNKATLFLLGIGAAVVYFASKLFSKNDDSTAKAGGILDGIKTGATGTTASLYGFKAPVSGILGGAVGAYGAATGRATKSGAGVTVNLDDFLKRVGGWFSSEPDPLISTERDYQVALAEANAGVTLNDGREFYSQGGAYYPANYSTGSDYAAAQQRGYAETYSGDIDTSPGPAIFHDL